ncbi:hypothetical protein GCM10022419_112440 [Nonomuraea rosea]|uniref:PE-PGRS family protein n=1 Tax=Nonomuraea rosea TaxID=638574 RepID=A0ABP6ZKG9_9ACTN
MNVASRRDAWTYDDFTSGELDPTRWRVLAVKGANGERHAYQDRNARLRTGDGRFELSVNPFSRFHDTDPMQNNAKQMYQSVQRFIVPAGGRLKVAVEMAVQTYGQLPGDLLDAFGTMNVFDLETGVVFNFAATNDTVYAVVERLVIPGVSRPEEHYVHRVVLEVPTEPGREHRYAIDYRSETSEAVWYVDGRRAYWARTPVPVEGFHVGMALFSARDLSRYSREEREHGQGATGRWSPWRITASGPAHGPIR